MVVIRTFQFQIFPNPEQEAQFLQWAGCRRFIYNWGLGRKQVVYAEVKKSIGYKALASELVQLKKQPQFDFLNDCPSQALQQALMDLEKSFAAFFKKVAKYPRFRCKGKHLPTFRIPERASIIDGKVYLPKVIGLVDINFHREFSGIIKSATFKQDNKGRWFVTFVAHQEAPDIEEPFKSPVGLDAGLTDFLVDSNGKKTKPPRFYRKAQLKIRRDDKTLERRSKRETKKNGKRGKLLSNQSNNRTKALGRLARTHARAANRRKDFLHKLSNDICKAHDVVCIEDLNIQALTKSKLKGHSKSFYDAAHSQFRFYLEYKAQREGGVVIRVDRLFPSSKLCSTPGCDYKNDTLTMSDRSWMCPKCKITHDRDINAAINILNEVLRILAGGNPERLHACRPYEDGHTAIAVRWRTCKTRIERGGRRPTKQELQL